MIDLEDIFDFFGSCLVYLVLAIIGVHIVMRVIGRKKPVKLDKDSFVVITGGCMGIGKQMALELAKRYQCSLLIIDRRKDLFASVTAEIAEIGGTCECKETDLGSEGSVSELINFLLGRKKGIDLFIYNAGVMIPKTAW